MQNLVLAAAFLLAGPLAAQQPPAPSQEDLQARLEAKLAKPFVAAGGWVADWDVARQRAAQEKKFIFAYFTRSYTECPKCEALESRALSDPAFPAFAAKVVPFLHVTTQIKERKFDGLLKAKGFKGFPTLAIMDATGGVLLVVAERSVSSFDKALATVTEWDGVQQRVNAGEKGLEFALLAAEWKMGKLDYPAVKARANTMQTLEPAQKEALAQILLDAEVIHLYMAASSTKDGFEPAVNRYLAILHAGKLMPSGDAEMMFWTTLMRKADMDPVDAVLYEQALAVFERLYGNRPNQAEALQKMRDRLAEMRKGSP